MAAIGGLLRSHTLRTFITPGVLLHCVVTTCSSTWLEPRDIQEGDEQVEAVSNLTGLAHRAQPRQPAAT